MSTGRLLMTFWHKKTQPSRGWLRGNALLYNWKITKRIGFRA
ncbi:hypothetical protein [Rubritalea tangerina]